jgi:tetratricopeptide (TPR) repeat protein/predicted Ser/Thr protein kinase
MDAPPPPRDSPTPAERRGTRFGRYTILDVLGEGGMGVVYTAFDPQLDRKIAIKVLHRRALQEAADVQARLLREAQAMARLAHPNVVTIHDVGTVNGEVFLAMEYVEGPTLKEWLRERRPWPERLEVVAAAGRGLAAAHAAGIVHRDFKPDNVLVGRDGRVRVTDFGIARAEGEEGPAPAPPSGDARATSTRVRAAVAELAGAGAGAAFLESPLTNSGSILGTVGYMAPEQAFNERVDTRSDQFSFCVTLYVALYGERPFPADSLDDYADALARPVPDPPPGSKIPTWIRRILLKGLGDDPATRYPSMDALIAALDRDPAVRRRRGLAVGGAAALMVLGAVVYRASARSESPRCVGAAQELAGVWDSGAREDARNAFVATGAVGAAGSFDRAARGLDAYAEAWTTMRTDACAATEIRHEQSEDVYRLRAECLDRAKTELLALTQIFRHADPGVVESSVKAVYGLPAVSWCADVNGLRAAPGLPADPQQRADVVASREQLARATSLGLAGKHDEALAEAQHALATARVASHASTEAEALLLVGQTRQRLGDYAGSEATLGEAIATAYASGNDVVAIRASAILGFVVGDKLYRPAEADLLMRMASAGLRRVGGSEQLQAEVESQHALVLVAEGFPERAIPMLDGSIRTFRRTLGAHPLTAARLNNLGYAYHVSGRHEDAFAPLNEAYAIVLAAYGVENREAAIPLCNLGAASLALGRVPDAVTYLRRALDVFEREAADGFWSGWALQYVTRAAQLRGDLPGALASGRRGLAIMHKLDTSLRLVPGNSVATADVLLALGKPDEALALCEGAVAVQQEVGLIDPGKVYEWDALRCRGEALLALHRASEAIAPLERAAALPRRVFPGDMARARFALARALVESHGDAARARSLAEQARAELDASPSLADQRSSVDRWLASRP